MATVKLNPILSDLRGIYAQSIFSKNHFGLYIRPNTFQTPTRTDTQEIIRHQFILLSKLWQTLSDTQRATWKNPTGIPKKSNKFHELFTATPFNLFMSTNMDNFIYGDKLPIIQAPPFTTPTPVTFSNFIAVSSSPSLNITLCNNLPADSLLSIWLTPLYSAGQLCPINKMIIIQNNDSPFIAQPISLYNNWNYCFGDLIAGKKISLRAYLLSGHSLKRYGKFLQQSTFTTIVQ
jgi:hypothetical protein